MPERRVLCVGANPSFDVTLTLDALDADRVNRVRHEHREAAGKGANVACALAAEGIPVAMTGLFGRDSLAEWLALFREREGGAAVCTLPVSIPGRIRENLTLLAGGSTVKLNRAGPPADADALASFGGVIASALHPGDVACFSGSLPPGMSADALAGMTALAAERGALVALDTDALDEGTLLAARPWLYKPNAHELAALCGLPDNTEDVTLIRHAQRLAQSGVGAVLLTLGARGLVLVTRGETVAVPPRPVAAVNTVGAGDAALAAYISAFLRDLAPAGCARAASAAGERAVSRRHTAD